MSKKKEWRLQRQLNGKSWSKGSKDSSAYGRWSIIHLSDAFVLVEYSVHAQQRQHSEPIFLGPLFPAHVYQVRCRSTFTNKAKPLGKNAFALFLLRINLTSLEEPKV
jgi:hypothetical protein